LPELAKKVSSFQLTNVALVDCTASSDVVEAYNLFVDANMHIITPNKKANVLPWAEYAGLIDRLSLRQKHFLYEANVGAGLPIISTLQDLISSGDAVQRIEGVLSGTLSYLFNMYDDSVPFSKLVKEAQVLGYTEPDPREDLGGQDVARKLLILARQLGYKMELADIMVESLVPAALSKGTFSEPWYAKFAKYDGDISAIYKKAHAKGNVLRFAGVLENGKAKAGLSEFPESHPFAKITGSDNIVVFSTARYSSSPLVVQGPGAGADVTAMGVFSDLLKLLHYLPY
jgi:aspartokinase/homoserine dehydrogenase 1